MLKHFKMLSKFQLNFVGWLSIATVILTIPYLAIAIFAAVSNPNMQTKWSPIATISGLIFTVIYIYIFYVLKYWLNHKFAFYLANNAINVLIVLQIIFYLYIESFNFFQKVPDMLLILVVLLLIVFGIMLINLGVKMLELEDNVYGLLKPFAYQSIAAGVMYATIILFPLAIITDLIAKITLGIIFLRTASETSSIHVRKPNST